MTVKWIAERLQMGAPGCVNHLLYLRRKTEVANIKNSPVYEGFAGAGVTGRKRFERNCWGRWSAGHAKLLGSLWGGAGRVDGRARRGDSGGRNETAAVRGGGVGRAKGDAGKVAMAARLRAETTMTLKWIAGRLRM